MKKYAALLAINALILCALSVNALLQIAESCDSSGRCADAIGPVTWGMALLPILIILGVGVAVLPKLIRGLKAESAARVTRKAEAVEVARTAPSDAGVEEAMANRLLRVSRPNSGMDAGEDIDEGDDAGAIAADLAEADAPAVQPEQSADADAWQVDAPQDLPLAEHGFAPAFDEDVTQDDCDGLDLSDIEMADDDEAIAAHWTDSDDLPSPPDLVLAVDNDVTIAADSAPPQSHELWAWLVNDQRVPQLHPAAQTGFPWVAAVVDEVAGAASDLANAAELSSFAAEATAWQAIVTELHATQPIAGQDAESFVGWVNDLVVHCHLIGSGLTAASLLDRTMSRLDDRCCDDEELAAVLDTIFGIGDGEEDRRIGAV